jgi:hypothetical protein
MTVVASLAPILVFAYMRPAHLAKTIESLRLNPEAVASNLYVYCDAAKRARDLDAVNAVRAYADRIEGFASVQVVKRGRNLGLAASIIDGVSCITASHGRTIVVEDDLVVSPHFLRFMNDGLDRYADEPRVASIHGYCYPTGQTLPETFFLRGADCWGWATWSRAWSHFVADGSRLRAALLARKLVRDFDLDGAYPFFRMLEHQIAGRNDSWAIRWHASCFLDDMLTLYPGRSLVHNIGNDGSGTHSGVTSAFAQAVATEPVPVMAQAIEPSIEARRAFVQHLARQQGLMRRFRAWLQHCGGTVRAAA